MSDSVGQILEVELEPLPNVQAEIWYTYETPTTMQ